MVGGQILDELADARAELVREVRRRGADEGVDVVARRLGHAGKPNRVESRRTRRSARTPCVTPLVAISSELSARVDALAFPSVPYVYNPLVYARAPHEAYLERWGASAPREVVMVGMNPGPFGMAQTGVPFGDVAMVRDFLGITGPVGKPPREHPLRPVAGFACTRSEVSGTRFWGWARDRFGTAERFFDRVFVANWCPLVFMEASGQEPHPGQAPGERARRALLGVRRALARVVEVLASAARRRRRPLRGAACSARARLATCGSAASSIRARRARRRIATGPPPSTRQLRALGFEPAAAKPSGADSVATVRRPTTVELMLLAHGPALGAQPERHEVHPRARTAAALVRDDPVRPRRRDLRRPHSRRRAVASDRATPSAS